MKLQVLSNKRLILYIILGLTFVFFVPLEFAFFSSTDSTSYVIFNAMFYVQADIGTVSHTLFRWTWIRYPLSFLLTIASLVFVARLHQCRNKAYPIFSASAVGIALWSVPIYFFIQFFSVSSFYWIDIFMSAPLPIGFCGVLFLIFVILPSIQWHSNLTSTSRSISGLGNDEKTASASGVILTPKRGSSLAFLAAFLLPGLILLQSTAMLEYSDFNISYLGFLVQFQTSSMWYLSNPVSQQYAYFVQEIATWTTFGVSILCCAPSLLFAWFVMRYVHGMSSKRSTILVGVLSELPPLMYAIFGYAFEYGWLIIPFPLAFIVGLLVMRFTHVIEPRKKTELSDSEIRVPWKTRLGSRFMKHNNISIRARAEKKAEDKDEEN